DPTMSLVMCWEVVPDLNTEPQGEMFEMRKSKACSFAPRLESEQVGQSSGDALTSKSKKPRKKKKKKKTSNPISRADTTKDVEPNGSEAANPEVKDPLITKRQGRPREKRYKTGFDLLPPKPKPCKYCLSTEHTTSKCRAKPPRKRTQQFAKCAYKARIDGW
ncbi:unnamed protein product, partial [Urochloa humidicola]